MTAPLGEHEPGLATQSASHSSQPNRQLTSRSRFVDYLARLKKTAGQSSKAGDSSEASGNDPAAAATPKPRQRSVWQLVAQFWLLLGPHRRPVLLALSIVTVSTVLGLAPPAATKLIIDEVLSPRSTPRVWLPADWSAGTLLSVVLVGMLGLSLLASVVSLSGRWLATRTVKRVQLFLRKRVFEHASRLPLTRVNELKSGGAASLLREDGGSIGELVFGLLYNPWRALVQLVGSLLILALVDWRLLAGGLLLLPVVYFTHRTWIAQIRPQFRAVRKTRQDMDAQTAEAFGGMRVVRAFGRQRTEAGRFLRSNNLLSRQELWAWWWTRGVELLWEALIPAGSAVLLWYGGLRVLAGSLTLGDVMMFLAYLLMLLEPLAVLAESAASLQNSLAGLDRVLDLLAEPREMTGTLPVAVAIGGVIKPETNQAHQSAAVKPLTRLERSQVRGALTFEGVSFHYPGREQRVIQGLNLQVPAGSTLALVGPSGAGKTTLSNLAARFYDPTAGRVLLDGTDLRQYDVESYRRLLGVVEQDVFLFDGTVAANIAYGRRDASFADLVRAAEIAQAAPFIAELPQGYETLIGERGVKLSGGQRQRLAIARAILADPKLLILDEATSNLDSESEQRIQQGLDHLRRGRTCIVIAHRLSTIRHADLIAVLDQGQIVEQGTHEQLLAQSTRYSEMIQRQGGFSATATL